MNTEEEDKLTTEEKVVGAAGCLFVLLINLGWFALAILAIAALIKFVAG